MMQIKERQMRAFALAKGAPAGTSSERAAKELKEKSEMNMKTALLGALLAMPAAPVLAQDTGIPSDWNLSGNVGLFTDYRFRGVSLTDEQVALQGGLDLAHASGFYVGTWASNLAGFGTFGGANLELDVYAGFGGGIGEAGEFDVGVLWYLYPGTEDTDYVELYGSVGGALGPASVKLGAAYAPDQDSIGDDNLYVYADMGVGVPTTPVTINGHVGYTEGALGYGGAGFDDNYIDWSVGADVELYGLTFGLYYVDTDISKAREVATGVKFPGSSWIADDQIVGSVSYSF